MASKRQEAAAQKFVENGGKSVSAAMRAAGYSEATAKNPDKLTQSDAWQELMDKYLPDKKLVEVHKKILGSAKLEHMAFPLELEDDDIKRLIASIGGKIKKILHGEHVIDVWYLVPDQKARANGLDLGYKVKGKLKQKVEGELKGDLVVKITSYKDDGSTDTV